MNYLRKSGLLSDCSFELTDSDGKTIVIKCHKCILICASPVFEGMFLGDFKEANNNAPIPIMDAPADAFENFIDYLYCEAGGPAMDQLDYETVKSLLYISHKYMVSFMIDKSSRALSDMVDKGLPPNIVVEIYKIANQIENNNLASKIFITMLNDIKSTMTCEENLYKLIRICQIENSQRVKKN
ncbi:uncharacterized protein LOC124460731 [Drosophila willistoni]|uniref:uncharacterized protein LOC124460731 n=1 Tax=Drosophila willistoni TaxID=7260 RepID=UPI001F072DD8|nr:uncharacterized protein LOC124460731 [Drosophila willistoni]